jgi:hypothetical protein
MSQFDLGTIDPDETSGTELADLLGDWRDAVHSSHSGSSRPSYVTAGMIWLDTSETPSVLKLYNGTDDVVLGTLGADLLTYPSAGVAENKLLNPSFEFWRLGATSFTDHAETSYFANRWHGRRASNSTGYTVSRIASGVHGPNGVRLQRTSGDTSADSIVLAQTLFNDDAVELTGKTVTFSVYARAGTGYTGVNSGEAQIKIVTGTGTNERGDGFSFTSGSAEAASASLVLTTSWQRITVTGDIPSNATQVMVNMRHRTDGTTAGAADYVEFTDAQLVIGPVAAPFRRPRKELEEQLCGKVGDTKHVMAASAPDGWLLLNGATIGSASSGATHTGALYEQLYTLMWNSFANAEMPVSSGRGSRASADWAANKTLTLQDGRGRVTLGSGDGASTTARTHGDIGGAETDSATTGGPSSQSTGLEGGGPNTPASSNHTHSVTVDTMQPWLAFNQVVKF